MTTEQKEKHLYKLLRAVTTATELNWMAESDRIYSTEFGYSIYPSDIGFQLKGDDGTSGEFLTIKSLCDELKLWIETDRQAA